MFRVLAFVSILLIPSLGFAETYRCNGYVQFRPCDQRAGLDTDVPPLPTIHQKGDSKAQRVRAKKVNWGSGSFSKIIRQSFRKYSPREGLWSGRLLGNGVVHLTLQIFRNGELASSRYMGKVRMTPQDKDISFNFRAPIPKGGQWSWKIVTG